MDSADLMRFTQLQGMQFSHFLLLFSLCDWQSEESSVIQAVCCVCLSLHPPICLPHNVSLKCNSNSRGEEKNWSKLLYCLPCLVLIPKSKLYVCIVCVCELSWVESIQLRKSTPLTSPSWKNLSSWTRDEGCRENNSRMEESNGHTTKCYTLKSSFRLPTGQDWAITGQ